MANESFRLTKPIHNLKWNHSSMEAQFRIVRFLVHDGPIWRFDDRIVVVEEPPIRPNFQRPGDAHVAPCDTGHVIFLAVKPFDDLSLALLANHREWHESAVAALKSHFRLESPESGLRLFRDPVDGILRNLVE